MVDTSVTIKSSTVLDKLLNQNTNIDQHEKQLFIQIVRGIASCTL